VSRALSPQTNPTGLASAAGALYVIVQWAWTETGHKGTASPVVVALAFTIVSLITRYYVTPVADPRDPLGRPLVPLPPPKPLSWQETGTSSSVTVVQPKIPGEAP
jgi:hypothetical protein